MEINEISHNLASWSLSRLIEQQSYIAQNIANANVENYKPVHADFSKAIDSIKELNNNKQALQQHLQTADLNPVLKYQTQGLLSDKVELDKEVSLLFKNSSQYNSIIEVLNRNFGLMKLAIKSRS